MHDLSAYWTRVEVVRADVVFVGLISTAPCTVVLPRCSQATVNLLYGRHRWRAKYTQRRRTENDDYDCLNIETDVCPGEGVHREEGLSTQAGWRASGSRVGDGWIGEGGLLW